MTPPIGAIVLAGGRSSRFGRNKLAEVTGGRSLLDHAIGAVGAVAGEIVVVGAPDASLILPEGITLARDAAAFEGPLAGLAAGLAAIDPSVDRVVVVAGDMPSLVPAVLMRLVEALGPTVDAVILGVAGTPGPLPMAVRAAVARPVIRGLLDAGERRLRALPEALETHVIAEATWRLDDPDGRTLRDVDTPSDL